ncbi:MAG: RNA polymerase sigma factor [Bacteroidales bacterium]|nr:RNA polymerase sigma factor [Bacteroidales bacterium]
MRFRVKNIEQYSDEQLMSLLAKDNMEAFELLYNRYSLRTKCFFLRMISSENDEAEDLNQELYLKVYTSRYSFLENYKFDSWLFSICYNLCKNHYRHNDVVEHHKQEMLYQDDPIESPDFEINYDKEIFQKRLELILSKLSQEQLACFTLRYNEEMSVNDIAAVLGCPSGTVKSRLNSAMNIISSNLKEYNFIIEQ